MTPPVRNAEAMYRKPVGAAILFRAGNNDDGLDGKCMVARKGGGRNVRQNVGGLATVTIDYQGGCRGVWIKQAMFLLKEKVVQGILSNAVFLQKYYFLRIYFLFFFAFGQFANLLSGWWPLDHSTVKGFEMNFKNQSMRPRKPGFRIHFS